MTSTRGCRGLCRRDPVTLRDIPSSHRHHLMTTLHLASHQLDSNDCHCSLTDASLTLTRLFESTKLYQFRHSSRRPKYDVLPIYYTLYCSGDAKARLTPPPLSPSERHVSLRLLSPHPPNLSQQMSERPGSCGRHTREDDTPL